MEFLNSKTMLRTRSRRFFFAAASAAIGSMFLLKNLLSKKRSGGTAKFLTREGRLVEVPLDKLPLKKVAITRDRLVSWIWKHQKL